MEIPTIASLERSYTEIVDAARSRVIGDLSQHARLELARIYVRELDAVYLRLAAQEITEETARGIIKSLERALARYMAQAEPEIKRQVFRALKHMQEAHAQATAAVPALDVGFAGVPTEAFEEMYKRRALGVVKSFKTLRKWNATRAAVQIEKTLEATLLQGLGPQEAVERIAYALASPNEFTRKAVERYATGGGVQKFMRAGARYANITDEAFIAAKRISYDAWRIVRTEMASAAIEGDRVASIRSPVIEGMKWNLSPRHPKPDICDLYAKLDLHGMGPGVFPAELYPPLAHPHDLCYSTHTFRDPSEWGLPNRAPAPARTPKASEVRRILPTVTPRASLRAWQQVRRDTRRASKAWASLRPLL